MSFPTDKELDDIVALAKKHGAYRVWHNRGNPNNKLYHVRGVVDCWGIVVRTWWKQKRRWHYTVEMAWSLFWDIEIGCLYWGKKIPQEPK